MIRNQTTQGNRQTKRGTIGSGERKVSLEPFEASWKRLLSNRTVGRSMKGSETVRPTIKLFDRTADDFSMNGGTAIFGR